jgi:NADPH-dependent 7-cyano-7-deazaguanine reductase QueF
MEEKELERWIRAFRGDRQLKEYVVEYIEDELEFAQDLLKRARFLNKKFGVRS